MCVGVKQDSTFWRDTSNEGLAGSASPVGRDHPVAQFCSE